MERSLKELVEVIAKGLVDYPEDVIVRESASRGKTVLTLSVNDRDFGKVIGKQGKIAKSIRTVLKAAAIKNDVNVVLDIEDKVQK